MTYKTECGHWHCDITCANRMATRTVNYYCKGANLELDGERSYKATHAAAPGTRPCVPGGCKDDSGVLPPYQSNAVRCAVAHSSTGPGLCARNCNVLSIHHRV